MSIQGIALFTLRAAGFASIACIVYALICRLRSKSISAGRLLTVFYIASLMEITVLRGGIAWNGLFDAQRQAVQWIPFRTTFGELKSGVWPFLYHAGGNIAWFLPLGLLMRKKTARAALLSGLLVSAGIECLQWLLMTGMTDVDDVILNAFGALAGFLLAKIVACPKNIQE